MVEGRMLQTPLCFLELHYRIWPPKKKYFHGCIIKTARTSVIIIACLDCIKVKSQLEEQWFGESSEFKILTLWNAHSVARHRVLLGTRTSPLSPLLKWEWLLEELFLSLATKKYKSNVKHKLNHFTSKEVATFTTVFQVMTRNSRNQKRNWWKRLSDLMAIMSSVGKKRHSSSNSRWSRRILTPAARPSWWCNWLPTAAMALPGCNRCSSTTIATIRRFKAWWTSKRNLCNWIVLVSTRKLTNQWRRRLLQGTRRLTRMAAMLLSPKPCNREETWWRPSRLRRSGRVQSTLYSNKILGRICWSAISWRKLGNGHRGSLPLRGRSQISLIQWDCKGLRTAREKKIWGRRPKETEGGWTTKRISLWATWHPCTWSWVKKIQIYQTKPAIKAQVLNISWRGFTASTQTNFSNLITQKCTQNTRSKIQMRKTTRPRR